MRYRRRRGLSSSWWKRDDRAEGGGGPEAGGSGTGGSPPGGRREWGRVTAVALVTAALFGAGYLLSSWWLFPGSSDGAEAGEVVEVPELVGLTVEEARGALEAADLTYRLRSEVSHPRAPEGAVVAQSPLPGQLARPGAPVSVSVSLGPESRVVPDLRGVSDRQARIVLERLGFAVEVDSARSQVERGRVVETLPEAGSEMALPGEVTMVVSEGPEVAEVPDLAGLHVDDVEDRLDEVGLELGEVTYDPEAFAAPGRVIGQSPPPEYALRVGGSVAVRVAGEPPEEPGR